MLYHADGCHLCEKARAVLAAELGAEAFEEVDIATDPGLEARYRERIPVVSVDGADAFTYFVQPDALRERLGRP